MRIEETSPGSYVKIPHKLETDIINVMNRFFVSDPSEIQNSREGIILEIQKRIRPMITNMVKRIAWVEGEAIFTTQLETVLNQEIAKVLEGIMETILSMRTQLLEHVPLNFLISEPTTFIDIPDDVSVNDTVDVVQVFVNGMFQKKGLTYEYEMDEYNTNAIRKIVFNDELENGDDIDLEIWIYSEAVNNYNGGATNVEP